MNTQKPAIEQATGDANTAAESANQAAEAARQAVEDMPEIANEENVRNIVRNYSVTA